MDCFDFLILCMIRKMENICQVQYKEISLSLVIKIGHKNWRWIKKRERVIC